MSVVGTGAGGVPVVLAPLGSMPPIVRCPEPGEARHSGNPTAEPVPGALERPRLREDVPGFAVAGDPGRSRLGSGEAERGGQDEGDPERTKTVVRHETSWAVGRREAGMAPGARDTVRMT